MNFMIIQNDQVEDTTKPPFPIIQMFTDDEMQALAAFIQDTIDNHGNLDDDKGCMVAYTFLELLGQWEDKTQ